MDIRTTFLCVAVSASALLGGCGSTPVSVPSPVAEPVLTFDPRPFGERPDIASIADLFELPDSRKRGFLNYFHSPQQTTTPGHERIYNYIFAATADFDYHNDTLTAAETLENSAGNCLSLAILTTSLAKLTDVDVGYLLVDSRPVFELRGDVISKGIHVRSILYDPSWQAESDGSTGTRRPGIQFDYFPDSTQHSRLVGNVPYNAYVAMYYSNMAGEALTRNDVNSAFWYALESFELEPENEAALNTLAVVYRRVGDDTTAENVYKFGIGKWPKNVSLLRNYRLLLTLQGRHAEAASIDSRLAKLDDQNPFTWINAGRNALSDEEYREAVKYFRKALEIAPYLHEAHALMSVAHLKMGDTQRGRRELQSALEKTQRVTTRSLYEAKLTLFDN